MRKFELLNFSVPSRVRKVKKVPSSHRQHWYDTHYSLVFERYPHLQRTTKTKETTASQIYCVIRI